MDDVEDADDDDEDDNMESRLCVLDHGNTIKEATCNQIFLSFPIPIYPFRNFRPLAPPALMSIVAVVGVVVVVVVVLVVVVVAVVGAGLTRLVLVLALLLCSSRCSAGLPHMCPLPCRTGSPQSPLTLNEKM